MHVAGVLLARLLPLLPLEVIERMLMCPCVCVKWNFNPIYFQSALPALDLAGVMS